MKNVLLTLLFISMNFLTLQAQEMSASDAMKSINKIKMDNHYITASGTSMKGYEEARDNALAVLQLEVENWLKETKQTDASGVMMPTKDKCMVIETQRGNLYRVFLYVTKKSIIPMSNDEQLVVVTENPSTVTTSPATTINPETVVTTNPMETTITPVYEPTPFEQQMLQVKKAVGIESFVKQSYIAQYGKYIDRPQTGSYYLLLYNREGEVPACLKFDNGTLTNVATGKEDTFDNYKGCGAYWFIQK